MVVNIVPNEKEFNNFFKKKINICQKYRLFFKQRS